MKLLKKEHSFPAGHKIYCRRFLLRALLSTVRAVRCPELAAPTGRRNATSTKQDAAGALLYKEAAE